MDEMDFPTNEVVVDVSKYRHYWLGIPKIGKSTSFRDMVEKLFGNPKYGLLISMGEESGAKAIPRLKVKATPDWDSFIELADYLVDHKEKVDFKMLAFDTVDEFVSIAEKQVMYLHRVRKGESATSIKAAFGGYAAGKRMAIDLIRTQIGRLERAGYSFVFIGHTKFKDVKDKMLDETFQQLTSNLESDYHSVFSNMSDIMAMMKLEREIKGDKLVGERRIIQFRGSMDVESGSRLPADCLPEKINLNMDEYISAIENALKKISGLDGKKFEEKKIEQENESKKQSEKFIESEKKKDDAGEVSLEQYRNEMLEYAKNLSAEVTSLKKVELKKRNLPLNFSQEEDMETLKKIHSVIYAD